MKNFVKIKIVKMIIAIVAITLVVGVGIYMISASNASAPYGESAASSGSLTTGATIASNSSAINGKYVQFDTSTGSSSGGSEHIISTLYAYPTLSSWQQVESAAPTVKYSIVDVCAPDGSGSGCNGQPADEKNTDWTATITALKNAGITPLYYISANYGAVALSTVEQEIQSAISWYDTPDPMFDTMQPSGTCNNGGSPIPCTTYYGDLYSYALSQGANTVVYNPGTIYNVSSADMFGSDEVIQIFEGTASSFETTTFPSWVSSYPANEFAATLSEGTPSTIGTDVNDAVKDGIGNFYEDDENEPPNYSTLPAYWSTEVSDVAAVK